MTVYYKMRQILIQNATAVLLQNATENYYKLRQYNDECSEDVKGECSFAKYTLRNYSEESLKKFSGLKWCIFQETFRRNHWPKFLIKKECIHAMLDNNTFTRSRPLIKRLLRALICAFCLKGTWRKRFLKMIRYTIFNDQICKCYCKVLSAIWDIFSEFLIFCNLFHEPLDGWNNSKIWETKKTLGNVARGNVW